MYIYYMYIMYAVHPEQDERTREFALLVSFAVRQAASWRERGTGKICVL